MGSESLSMRLLVCTFPKRIEYMKIGYDRALLAIALSLFAFQSTQAQEFIRQRASDDFARRFDAFSRSLDTLANDMRRAYDESNLSKAKQTALTSIPSEFGNNNFNGSQPQLFSGTQGVGVGGFGGGGFGFGGLGGPFGTGLFGGGLAGVDSNDFGIGVGPSIGPNDTFFGGFNEQRFSTLRTNGTNGPVVGSAFPPGRTVNESSNTVLRRQGSNFVAQRNFSSTGSPNDGTTNGTNSAATTNRSSTTSSTWNGGAFNTQNTSSRTFSDGTQNFGTWSITGNAPGTVAGPGMAGTPSGSGTPGGGGATPTGVAGGGGGGTM